MSMGQGDPAGFKNPYRCDANGVASTSGDRDCYKLKTAAFVKKSNLEKELFKLETTTSPDSL